MAADAVMLASSVWLALTLRYLGVLVFEPEAIEKGLTFADYVSRHVWSTVILVSVGMGVFYLSGFYTYGRAYRGRYKALVIVQAVTLAYVVFGFLAFVFYGISWFPRSALVLGWGFTTSLLIASRVWSKLWKWIAARELGAIHTAGVDDVRNVLVVGGAGYIGSALLPLLLEKGYRVRVLDLFLFGKDPIRSVVDHPGLEIIEADFRHLDKIVEAVRGMDAVVHLGGIVGDPACAVDEALTIDVNVVATKMLAEIAKGSGVRRFIFASSCSVYGASNEILDEHAALLPLSLYAKSKIASERVLLEIGSPSFVTTILRFSTIYGFSGRTRFDLVVNLLTAKAITDGKITLVGGSQWRPFVHVEDAAASVLRVLETPGSAVRNGVFNIGSDEQNCTIQKLGEKIAELVPGSKIVLEGTEGDSRNYRVSFAKARRTLSFVPKWTLELGIKQVIEAFKSGLVADYRQPQHHNVKQLTEDGNVVLSRPQNDWAKEMLNAVPGPPPQAK